VLCFAPTRSGKGVGLVVPTLLTWPGSCIVHDIKGENWTLTSGFRSRHGRVLLFDPTNAKSAAYNPLLEGSPRRMGGPGRPECRGRAGRSSRWTGRRRCSYFVLLKSTRRFKPPWTLIRENSECYTVQDASGVTVAWLFCRDDSQRYSVGASKQTFGGSMSDRKGHQPHSRVIAASGILPTRGRATLAGQSTLSCRP
jgi:hypothetical protein